MHLEQGSLDRSVDGIKDQSIALQCLFGNWAGLNIRLHANGRCIDQDITRYTSRSYAF